ncbi:hypothetical protein M0811_04915 [Anaeramoeba ignava]|uniref:Uncharacterized protein n=1 Tax=Anaeramoeba ignava TaxID=1746090 RepID=A0A9Q0LWH2_ANAIG|nr:hypothetical protein M0811_04915 [Anaeramoeba ignava]
MFKIFVSLFLLIIILVVNSQTPTSCTTSFKDSNGVTHYYDFSAFMKKSTENPYIYEDLDNKYTYLFNICANVDNIVTCPCCTPSLATGWVIEAVKCY